MTEGESVLIYLGSAFLPQLEEALSAGDPHHKALLCIAIVADLRDALANPRENLCLWAGCQRPLTCHHDREETCALLAARDAGEEAGADDAASNSHEGAAHEGST